MDTLTIMLRILSLDAGNQEFELELPSSTTAGQIIEAMISEGHMDRVSENGEMIDYKVTLKDSDSINSGSTFHTDDTLESRGARNGSTLLINPTAVAA